MPALLKVNYTPVSVDSVYFSRAYLNRTCPILTRIPRRIRVKKGYGSRVEICRHAILACPRRFNEISDQIAHTLPARVHIP